MLFFVSTGKRKSRVFNSPGWKSVFEKLIFGDELLITLAGLRSQMSYLLGLHIAANGPLMNTASLTPYRQTP